MHASSALLHCSVLLAAIQPCQASALSLLPRSTVPRCLPALWGAHAGSNRLRSLGCMVASPVTSHRLWSIRGGGGDDELEDLIRQEDADIMSVYSKWGEEDTDEGPYLPELEDEDEDDGSTGSLLKFGKDMGGLDLRPRAFIILDPFSEFLGKYIRKKATERGLKSVDAVSPYVAAILGPGIRKFRAPRPGQESLWVSQLPYKVEFVLSESDVGLAVAERLQVACGCVGNGVNPARRHKFLTHEALRRRGAAAAEQVLAADWAQVEAFLDGLPPNDDKAPICVVKPMRGAASSDVSLCRTRDEARKAFDELLNQPKYGGGLNDRVLVQEYLRGQEYAVDTVSRNGVHKVLAVWRYDKREVNGAPVVYFGTELRAAPPGTIEHQVCKYVCESVLPALDVRWGPTHTEVINTPGRGPMIVELNARWHLTNFKPLCDECVGANALDATLDAFLDPEAFDALPTIPEKLRKHGRVVHLVSFAEGRVDSLNHIETIEALPSLRSLEVYPDFQPGRDVRKTTDIRSDAGYALLASTDPSQVEDDYKKILQLQETLFSVTPSSELGEIE